MARIEKLLEKLYKMPVPNDIRISELEKIARHYGCDVISGGKHPIKIVYKPLGTVIPIPVHGDTVKEAYIKEFKSLLAQIKGE